MQAAASSTISESYKTILETTAKTMAEKDIEMERRFAEEKETHFQQALAEKDKMIAMLQQRLTEEQEFGKTSFEALQGAHAETAAGIKDAMEAMRLQRANSSLKGQAGEAALLSLLSKAFGMAKDAYIEDVSKQSNAGDVRMLYMGLNIIWDAKAHEYKPQAKAAPAVRNINTDEVVKLRENVKTQGADVGIIVGLYAGISYHSTSVIDIDDTSAEPIIFINRLLLSEDPVAILQSLAPLFKILSKRKEKRIAGGDAPDAYSVYTEKLDKFATLFNSQTAKQSLKQGARTLNNSSGQLQPRTILW